MMRLGAVNSKLIAKIGHENGVLRVAYKDGAVFDYTAPTLTPDFAVG
jgi:hypothetical protein